MQMRTEQHSVSRDSYACIDNPNITTRHEEQLGVNGREVERGREMEREREREREMEGERGRCVEGRNTDQQNLRTITIITTIIIITVRFCCFLF